MKGFWGVGTRQRGRAATTTISMLVNRTHAQEPAVVHINPIHRFSPEISPSNAFAGCWGVGPKL